MDRQEFFYSTLEVKAFDEDRRTISGIASTPQSDRVNDIVVPKGARFANPIPLLLHHDRMSPIGEATLSKTATNITFEASIAKVDEPGPLKERLDLAWQSVKARLLRGASIGIKAVEEGVDFLANGGLKFNDYEIVELSLVTIPANQAATITSIKAFDAAHLAATGTEGVRPVHSSGVSDTTAAKAAVRKGAGRMKTIDERKQALVAERTAKAAKMTELMSSDEGTTLEASKQEEFDTLELEVKAIDQHLARLETLALVNKAVPVNAEDPAAAAASRTPAPAVVMPQIRITETLDKGIGFARAVKVATVARLENKNMLDVAKEMYSGDARLHAHINHVINVPRIISAIKANVLAGTTTNSVWASALVDPTNLAGEFIEYLRPATIIGKFGMGNIPALRSVPFNVRMIEQLTGGTGYWVGQGAPKPLTAFEFGAQTLAFTKVAAISVITEELARFSSPSAEALVRDGLRDALVERIDRDFIDPAEAGTANVQPASITNGLTALSSAGTSADNARTDLANLVDTFLQSNQNVEGLVLIMPTSLALSLSFQVNSLGQPEFPGLTMAGGSLNQIPVITSQYAANASGAGNMVIAVNAREIFLADDGAVKIDASREASLQMLDNPTNNSATATATQMVSMWQTDSIALRAERFINWAKRRSTAVVYMDDVNWGSIGSPS